MKSRRRYVASLISILLLTVLAAVGLTVLNARPKLGLDLRGGLSVVLTAEGEEVDPEVMDKTVEIIRERVDSIGAQEPDISRSGTNNIVVQLPGIDDPARALQVIGKTAQLRFRPVLEVRDEPTEEIEAARQQAREEGLQPGTEEFEEFVAAAVEEQTGWRLDEADPPDREVTFAGMDDRWFRLGPAAVMGDQVADAYARFDDGGQWLVEIRFSAEGALAFEEITRQLAPQGSEAGRPLGIVLDRVVASAPIVQDAITRGEASISGTFSERDARDLGLVLRTGALPIEMEQSQVRRVSPTLGSASLRAGLLAGAIGLVLVALYMLFFYRLLGLITLVGLGIFGVLVLGVIGLLGVTHGFTLTLAGIAGLIVSVGIAADSYIIYFERIKDELKEGKTFRSAVERAFQSAFRTNLAGNTVAFAAAIILYLLAIGPVRGFALALGISVLLDIFLLYFFTNSLVVLISRNKRLAGLRAVGMREAAAKRTVTAR